MSETPRQAVGRIAAAVSIVAASVAVLHGTGAASEPDPTAVRQAEFSAAAAEFGVPESVLLGVSYLQSRWDTNGGTPSTTAGYGPMHLTDAAPLLTGGTHHDHGTEDARGDDSRPLGPLSHGAAPVPERLQTAPLAAQLTGADLEAVKTDPAQNVRGGAALLAHYQRAAGGQPGADPAQWYQAVSAYGGSTQFADEVFAQIRQGADRVTDDGQRVTLAALDVSSPSSAATADPNVECPATLGCEWIPAPYQDLGGGDYGNHDLSQRPDRQQIRYIVVHDTEGSYETTLRLVQDPTYVSWQYTLRSSDGHVAQHVNSRDVAWQAGNWYVNATSIGLEHEGFAAQGTWYTEAMYRSSARLVKYLAQRFDIPLDRHHVIGHDQIPGILPANVRGMHWDPGPYWNWNHYFALMGAPIHPTGTPASGMVTMKPNWDTNRPAFYGCDSANPTAPCPSRSSSSVILHSAPSHDAPLLVDLGLHPDGSPSTMFISDHGSRTSAGTQWAVAEVRGDWTAVWYLGQKGWFFNPPTDPAAVWATGLVATPKAGRATIPVYGRAYPEPAAYPPTIPVQSIVPLQYTLHAGERYAVGQLVPGEYYRAVTFNCSGAGDCTVVRGQNRYYQIQFGHRMMFVNAADVDVVPSNLRR